MAWTIIGVLGGLVVGFVAGFATSVALEPEKSEQERLREAIAPLQQRLDEIERYSKSREVK